MVSSAFLVAALCVLSLYSANAFSLRDWPNKQVKLEAFQWKDCGASTNPAHVNVLSITPDPVKLPGNITVSTSFTLTTPSPTDLSVSLDLKKKIAGFWVKIPCVDDIGSCTYKVTCDDYKKICPQLEPYGIPCDCPIPAKTYNVNNAVAVVKQSIPGIASGDFQVTATVTSATAGQVVCLYVEATLA